MSLARFTKTVDVSEKGEKGLRGSEGEGEGGSEGEGGTSNGNESDSSGYSEQEDGREEGSFGECRIYTCVVYIYIYMMHV